METTAAPATPAAAPTRAPSAPCFISRADIPPLGTDAPELGGVVAAVMRGRDGAPDHLLIVSPRDTEATLPFGNRGHYVPHADHDTDGLSNTLNLVTSGREHPAAQHCQALAAAGHADWYLPARHELRACYLNVPEQFDPATWYWTSSQYAESSNFAWSQLFSNGTQDGYYKVWKGRVRAVRRLVLQ